MSRHLAYQTPSHQLLCPHLAHRLRIQSQFPRLQKTAVFQYPFSFAIPPPIHSGFSSEFLMVQGCFVQSTNPEACRLPVRPFQTSAKSFPLEDSLSGPMTLLASIPRCAKFYPTMERQVQYFKYQSLALIYLQQYQLLLILVAILQPSALLNRSHIKSKVRLRVLARCLRRPISLVIHFTQIC